MLAGGFDIRVELLPPIVSAVVFLTMSALIFIRDRLSPATWFLAAMLGSFGAYTLIGTAMFVEPALNAAGTTTSLLAFVFSALASVLVAISFPRPILRWVEHPTARLLPALPVAALTFAYFAHFVDAQTLMALCFAMGTAFATTFYILIVFRLVREPPGPARRSLLLLALGILGLASHYATANFLAVLTDGIPSDVGSLPRTISSLLNWPIVLTGFAILGRAAFGDDVQRARYSRLALGVALVATSTGALATLVPALGLSRVGTYWRLAQALLLAWGILRHEFLGIDLRVRWTLSKSTIAALFIAVFFVASEAAQEFFGDTLGSTYVGIAAAGALVFAMAPLQRAAERLAERAVPIPAGLDMPSLTSRKEEAYRGALRVALRDRVLTVEDENAIAQLCDEMAVTHRRAREIRLEVEEELTAKTDSGI